MGDVISTSVTPCPECGTLRAALEEALGQLQEAHQQIAQLQAELRELRSQVGRNSSNSSSPPALDPPGAPKPVVKTPTGRKPGGQPGHSGHHRHRLPPERVQHVVPFVPTACAHCQAPLPHDPAPGDPEPTWHQVAEVPMLAAIITEYQGHARTCPCCGHLTWATIPPEIRAHVVGPNLVAILSYFSGRHHLGKRSLEEVVETVFEVPIALGTVSTLESEMSAALAPAHDEAKDAVRAAAVKNTDETGWKQAGRRCWLWMAATATVAYFVIHARRNFAGLQALLGEAIQGIVGSDRWGAYNNLPLHLRQICWAHLKRDFQKLIDRGGPAEAIGRVGMDVVECLFADWWAFRRGDLDRAGLQARLDPMARELPEALEQGCGCADPKAVAFCENVLALYPALWLFAAVEGVEPTNNHAERLLRLGVLWRKNAFGSQSEAGCQFAARMLTVVQTLRLQKRPVLDYLRRAMIAHRSGLPAPQLLGQMGN